MCPSRFGLSNHPLRRFTLLFTFVFAVLVPGSLLGPVAPSSAVQTAAVDYQPPVSGGVVDGWRPGDGPYSAGNRGLEFQTSPGEPVRSPAPGVVSFAGLVAGKPWVVIRHPDGLRSSLGPVAAIRVGVGAQLEQGAVVGSAAGATLHWGVRRGSEYVDPGSLLPGPGGRVRLTK
jgi:murein DD-endopeptidase MepM/ murein hydrolase activator NlpD